MEHILALSEEESVCSSMGSVPSESDEQRFQEHRELRNLAMNMQKAKRRQATVANEQAALKRPHLDSIHNLNTILAGINKKRDEEVAAREEILAAVVGAKDKVVSDLTAVCTTCADVERRIQRFSDLTARDNQQRHDASVETDGVSLVLAEQRRKSRALLAEIETLRRAVVAQEQEVFDVKTAVNRIRENPQWDILGLQFMRQWSEDKTARLGIMNDVYLKAVVKRRSHAKARADRIPGRLAAITAVKAPKAANPSGDVPAQGVKAPDAGKGQTVSSTAGEVQVASPNSPSRTEIDKDRKSGKTKS